MPKDLFSSFVSQLGANLILLVTTSVLGILSFYLSDKKQRRAFLDTRQSLEMKLVIEEQAREQVGKILIIIIINHQEPFPFPTVRLSLYPISLSLSLSIRSETL
jgi:hypothetical protein